MNKVNTRIRVRNNRKCTGCYDSNKNKRWTKRQQFFLQISACSPEILFLLFTTPITVMKSIALADNAFGIEHSLRSTIISETGKNVSLFSFSFYWHFIQQFTWCPMSLDWYQSSLISSESFVQEKLTEGCYKLFHSTLRKIDRVISIESEENLGQSWMICDSKRAWKYLICYPLRPKRQE